MANTPNTTGTKDYNKDKDSTKTTQKDGQKKDGQKMVDTDNDGKLRKQGDTSDHGDPKSPFSKANKKTEDDDDTDNQ